VACRIGKTQQHRCCAVPLFKTSKAHRPARRLRRGGLITPAVGNCERIDQKEVSLHVWGRRRSLGDSNYRPCQLSAAEQACGALIEPGLVICPEMTASIAESCRRSETPSRAFWRCRRVKLRAATRPASPARPARNLLSWLNNPRTARRQRPDRRLVSFRRRRRERGALLQLRPRPRRLARSLSARNQHGDEGFDRWLRPVRPSGKRGGGSATHLISNIAPHCREPEAHARGKCCSNPDAPGVRTSSRRHGSSSAQHCGCSNPSIHRNGLLRAALFSAVRRGGAPVMGF
jgi:hypothetical protein